MFTLIVLVVAVFSAWWMRGHLFAPLDILHEFYEPWAGGDREIRVHNHFASDGVRQYLVYHRYAEISFTEDGYLGWMNLTGGGAPQYANTMALNHDWSVQLHRLVDYWTAWHLGLMGQFLIAALGMFVFLRSLRRGTWISMTAAILYATNSQFVVWVFHRWHLAAFCWVPWLLWAMHRTQGRDERSSWVLIPVFLALSLFGGNLQTNAFVVLVVIAVWAGWVQQWRADRRPVRRLTLHFVAWGALGVGLAAVDVFPNALAFFDNLAAGNLRGAVASHWKAERVPLYALLIPFQMMPTILGRPQSLDLAKLFDRDLLHVAYFGAFPALLALRGFVAVQAPKAAKWLVAIGLVLPLTPLVDALYPRIQLLYIVGGVWLFVWCWEEIPAWEDRFLRSLLWMFCFLLLLWLGGSVASVVFEESLVEIGTDTVHARLSAGEGQFNVYEEWMLERPKRLLRDLRIWHWRQLVIVGSTFVCFAALWMRSRGLARWTSPMLVVVLTIEMGAFAWSWVTVVDPEVYPPYEVTVDIAQVKQQVGEGRVFLIEDESRAPLLPMNVLAMHGVATIQQYESIKIPGIWWRLGFSEDAAALGLAGVTHAVAYPDAVLSASDWRLAYQGERLAVWENRWALPRELALRADGGPWLETAVRNPRGGVGWG